MSTEISVELLYKGRHVPEIKKLLSDSEYMLRLCEQYQLPAIDDFDDFLLVYDYRYMFLLTGDLDYCIERYKVEEISSGSNPLRYSPDGTPLFFTSYWFLKRAAKFCNIEFIYYVLNTYNLWNSKEHISIIIRYLFIYYDTCVKFILLLNDDKYFLIALEHAVKHQHSKSLSIKYLKILEDRAIPYNSALLASIGIWQLIEKPVNIRLAGILIDSVELFNGGVPDDIICIVELDRIKLIDWCLYYDAYNVFKHLLPTFTELEVCLKYRYPRSKIISYLKDIYYIPRSILFNNTYPTYNVVKWIYPYYSHLQLQYKEEQKVRHKDLVKVYSAYNIGSVSELLQLRMENAEFLIWLISKR